MKSLRHALTAVLATALAVVASPILGGSTAGAATSLGVPNGGFEAGTSPWHAAPARARATTVATSHSGDRAAEVRTTRRGAVRFRTTVRLSGSVGDRFRWEGHVRSNRTSQRARLVIRELANGKTVNHRRKTVSLNRGTWKEISLRLTSERSNPRFRIIVMSPNARRSDRLLVDTLKVARSEGSSSPGSGDCVLSQRGIPSCGALFGAGYGGSDAELDAWEKSMGDNLGVRRSYYQASQVDSAIRTVKDDLAAGRTPWISFKAPYSWAEMAAGKGDAWARDLAERLSKVNGPVWLAVHHEPQKDGVQANWTKMQERLAPIIRKHAPNVAYSVILTGWNAIYGPSEDRLHNIWPDTKIDIAGFDSYNNYGMVKNGEKVTKHTDLAGDYFGPMAKWAKSKGAAWAIAETGFTQAAALDRPNWMAGTYAALKANGGIAMTYFNSGRNSAADWTLSTRAKQKQFTDQLLKSPDF